MTTHHRRGRQAVITLLLVIAFLSHLSSARAQFINVDFERKVLYADSLHMPMNTSLGTVLMMLPEMIGRPGTDMFTTYDVLINGMSTFEAKDATLTQLRLSDVDKIEISESPTSSYQNNGQGGTVNFVLGTKDRGTWGSAALEASYSTDIMPAVTVGYRNSKWQVHGLALGEYYRPHNTVTQWDHDPRTGTSTPTVVTRETISTWNQLARLYTKCNLTSRDVLTWNLGQYTSSYRKTSTYQFTNDRLNSTHTTNTTLQTLLKYTHDFTPQSNITAEVQYVYTPSGDGFDQTLAMASDDSDITVDNHSKTHTVNGKLSYQVNLLPARSTKTCDLTIGLTANGSFTRGTTTFYNDDYSHYHPVYNRLYDTYYLMPFARIKMQIGRFRASIAGEYQHLNTRINPQQGNPQYQDYHNITDDFTCKLIGEWHFTPRQCLRLLIDRKLQRPNKVQLYPWSIFNPDKYQYVLGNSELRSEGILQVGMDYLSGYQWGAHRLQISLAANYYHVSDLILAYIVGGGTGGGGTIGLTQQFLTFRNDGHDNILAGGLMAVWQYRWLQVSTSANVFHNKQTTSDSRNHYTYYNISLQPSLSLPRNWGAVASFMYNSRVTRYNQYLGQSASLEVGINKTWHRLNIYAYGTISLLGNATDANVSNDMIHYYRHPQVSNGGGAGIRYTF